MAKAKKLKTLDDAQEYQVEQTVKAAKIETVKMSGEHAIINLGKEFEEMKVPRRFVSAQKITSGGFLTKDSKGVSFMTEKDFNESFVNEEETEETE